MDTLGLGQKPIIMPHYPHLLIEDTAVWTKFLNTDSHFIKELWYDVHVGQSMLLPVGASDLDKRIAAGVSRKRIDVVCRVSGGYWVVEIKPRANMIAVGQVLSYARLFTLEYSVPGEIWPVIVCDSADEDLIDEFDEYGIAVFVND